MSIKYGLCAKFSTKEAIHVGNGLTKSVTYSPIEIVKNVVVAKSG